MEPKESPVVYPVMKHQRFRHFARGFFRVVMRLFFRLEYAGLENLPASGPAILVANHTSMADMLVIQPPIRPWICWVAKKELFGSPLTRGVYTWLGCIPVDRGRTDMVAARGIITALRDKHIVGMFPQGTRVKPSRIPYVRPRSGAVHFALKTGAPILPVAVKGPFRLFGKVRIVYGKPIDLRQTVRGPVELEEMRAMAVDIMREVYALIGYDYHLVQSAGEV